MKGIWSGIDATYKEQINWQQQLTCSGNKCKQIRVAIVGAGAAGLTAARYLRRASPLIDVVILEARDKVGRRVQSAVLEECPDIGMRNLPHICL